MSTIIIITPPPKQQNQEQLLKDAEALREAGFRVEVFHAEKDKE